MTNLLAEYEAFFKKQYGIDVKLYSDGDTNTVIAVHRGKRNKKFKNILTWTQLFTAVNGWCKKHG